MSPLDSRKAHVAEGRASSLRPPGTAPTLADITSLPRAQRAALADLNEEAGRRVKHGWWTNGRLLRKATADKLVRAGLASVVRRKFEFRERLVPTHAGQQLLAVFQSRQEKRS